MPRKVHAAGCIVNSFSTNPTSQCLWITDALLAETLRRFCHAPRRYGSSVPGPLEARKRASKRKNTSLAYAGGVGSHVYDPAVMLESRSQDGWWKGVRTKSDALGQGYGQEVNESPKPLLPSWLLHPFDTLSVPHEASHKHMEVSCQTDDILIANNLQALDREFGARLALARDRKYIHKIIKEMQLNMREHPQLSEAAFQHLMKVHGRHDHPDRLAAALYDPILHPPGSSNHLFLIRHLCSRRNTRGEWDDFIFPALLKAAEFGLIPTKDLQELLRLIPEVLKTMTLPQFNNKLHTTWHRLVTAIESSRVLRMQDLDSKFLMRFFKQVSQTSFTDTRSLLLWRLRSYSGMSELELACELTRSTLADVVEVDSVASGKFTHWLCSLPEHIQGPVIIQASLKIIAAARNDEPLGRQILDKWSVILPQLKSEKLLCLPINKSTWSEASMVSCDLSSPQQLLAVIWTVTRLWAHEPDASNKLTSMGLQDEFESTFTNMEDSEQFDHVSRIVLTLDTLPLPDKDRIFPFLQHFSEENLIKMLGHKEHLEGLRSCFRRDYIQLQDNSFVRQARTEYPHLVRALTETINQDLPRFNAMAQTLILKSNENFRIVKRLLDYNMKLRFAAFSAWPSVMANRGTQDDPSQPNPKTILNVIESLIMTFAVTPVSSPRSAFSHVHKMYRFLHKIGAPINPVVGRALWHTGVTRYGQAGAPKAQVIWCLSKVREIEGEAAANRLLWSAGFRRNFLEEYVHLLANSTFAPRSLEKVQQPINPQTQKETLFPPVTSAPKVDLHTSEVTPRQRPTKEMYYDKKTGKVNTREVDTTVRRYGSQGRRHNGEKSR